MLTTYYTYAALGREWDELLRGKEVASAYSASARELVIAFTDDSSVVFGVRGALRYLFRSGRHGRPRRNATTLLPHAIGMRVRGVQTADRDRLLRITGDGDCDFLVVLYGSRPNVLLCVEGRIVDAFKSGASLIGTQEPEARSAKHPGSADMLLEIASKRPGSNRQIISRAYPLFDVELVKETVFRAGLACDVHFDDESASRLFEAAAAITCEIATTPAARVYWHGDEASAMSLIELRGRSGDRAEAFDTVDRCVAVFCRRLLAQASLQQRLDPVRSMAFDALERARRRVNKLESQLARPSRADTYERWGHLLMASGRGRDTELASISVADAFESGEPVEIPLDDEKSVMENAQHYYDRARRTRLARESALSRIEDARRDVQELLRDVSSLEGISTLPDLEAFLETAHPRIAQKGKRNARGRGAELPFRAFDLGRNYVLYVGRSARENDDLTFGFSRKYDIWMHARGVPGSHAVLRLPNKDATPDQRTLETAASIAAYFSKARGSGLVPVAYAPRKYVRKAKGAPPGKVIVERERVILVPPALPKTR